MVFHERYHTGAAWRQRIIVVLVVVAGTILGLTVFKKGKNGQVKYKTETLARGDIEDRQGALAGRKLAARFELPPGSYATVVLGELVKGEATALPVLFRVDASPEAAREAVLAGLQEEFGAACLRRGFWRPPERQSH